MNFKYVNRYIALTIFLLTLTLYRMTSQSSVAFWDCGEYAAAAPALEVPHPPGAPLFVLAGRIAMMTPYVSDPALRLNLISALTSALTIMFLYLIGVRVISRWRGFPSDTNSSLVVFGSSVIGALSFSVTDTFWFNAVESGLFATSMFFVAIVIWLGMVWYEKADEPGSQRYLLLAAYIMGLSIGIHQLSLLAYFTIALFIYFKYYEFEWKSFLKFGLITALSFMVIYPGIVKWLAQILNGDLKTGPFDISHSIIIQLIPPGLIAAAIYGVRKAERTRHWILGTAIMGGLLIILGYSTYTLVFVRSNAHTPINENNPSNLARLVTYLNREQYGEQRMWPRMWSSDPQYTERYKNYSSDLDYFLNFQLGHMYLRYIGFNFIGRTSDIQDDPVAFSSPSPGRYDGRTGFPTRFFAIPLFLSLFGIWYHVKKDWKFGLAFLTLFIMMGLALVVFFNMQNPQPRERDYFFVGSFFVLGMWLSVGAAGILEYFSEKMKESDRRNLIVAGTAVVIFGISPVNLFSQNLYVHNRHNNFAPWDYSYNILQSCKPNAILFTNGDNDTFPLWYLQEGMGIRTDIRIVNLSLVNTDWYILQLKNERPHGAMKVPISLTDDEIRNIQPIQWRTRSFKLAVPKEVYAAFGITDTSITNRGLIQYDLRPTLQVGDVEALRVQDIIMQNIIQTNAWKRPVFYAVTVSPDNFIGLGRYLEMQGLALELRPVQNGNPNEDYTINEPITQECFMNQPVRYATDPQYGFLFTNLNKPSIYYDDNVRMLMVNYRYGYMRLANYYMMRRDSTDALSALDTMEARVPIEAIPMNYRLLSDVARMYYGAGDTAKFYRYAAVVERDALAAIKENPKDVQGYYNPYGVLLSLYALENNYAKSLDILKQLQDLFPNDRSLADEIARTELKLNATQSPLDSTPLPKQK
ncbi:MAG TPA: DUF2723 domain-containing protein [Candidatus Kryptonia bacterium]